MNRNVLLWLSLAAPTLLVWPFAAAAAESAETSVYQLELIVFRNYPIDESERLLPLPPRSLITSKQTGVEEPDADASRVDGQTELFGSEASFGPRTADGRPIFKTYDNVIDLGSGTPGAPEAERWPLTNPEKFMLGDVFARMNRAYGYRILWHGAATLPMVRQRPYHFRLQTDSLDDGRWVLEAQLQFRLSRFMHIDATAVLTDLTGPANDNTSMAGDDDMGSTDQKAALQQAIKNATVNDPDQVMTIALAPNAPVYGRYILQQSRRMKSGQLHYLDHPAIGILAMIQSVDESGTPASNGALEDGFEGQESEEQAD